MPCYNPLRAWYTGSVNQETGKREVTFSRNNGLVDRELSLPCGKCIGCRIKYSQDWAIRCVHESQLYEQNSFLTLTYDDDYLPKDGSLNKKHFVDFMKRLRKSIQPKKIRYFMCGEYGEQLDRPHFHAIIFNHDFSDDRVEFKYRKSSILYTSEALNKLWPYGFSSIGSVTYATAAYVAKYAIKKITGELAEYHYQGKTPEYAQMSRMPGIGTEYFNRYRDEIFQHDSIVLNSREYPIPRFYTNKFEEEEIKTLKSNRVKKINTSENTIARLRVKEKILKQKLGEK